MIISVASGKGETGKTTVSTNLALSIETNVQLLDCDVEQPNESLFRLNWSPFRIAAAQNREPLNG